MGKMSPGMRMLAMTKATQGGNQGNYNRMGDGGQMMGDQMTMGNAPEMRRRRDSRGRYMEQDGGSRMAYEGDQGRMEYGGEARMWPDPHIPPYLDGLGVMDTQGRRDSNIVNIRDYQDKRRIGFGMNRMEDGEEDMDMRHYGRRYNPDRMTMGRSEHQTQMMGGSESDAYHLTREDAEKWVKGMKSEDGKTGGRWPLAEIKQYAGNFGIHGEDQIIEFFAVMNALYTDYCKVAKKYGVDKVDFWADLAKAFIHDKDAGEGKVKKYYECIAKHDDD